jgi:regulator of replication initiation timing
VDFLSLFVSVAVNEHHGGACVNKTEHMELNRSLCWTVFSEYDDPAFGSHSFTQTLSAVDDMLALLARGTAARRIGETRMNRESSRSHCVLTLTVESRTCKEGEAGAVVRTARLNLVDLAGSERSAQAETEGARLREAAAINRSLLALGIVIAKLAEGQAHVPYRDSKLTFLLQESLGGNSRSVVIATASPAAGCGGETLGTLGFARRAKQVRNRAVVNEEVAASAAELAGEVSRLRAENAALRSAAAVACNGNNADSKGEKPEDEVLEMRNKVERLHGELQEAASERAELQERCAAQATELAALGAALAEARFRAEGAATSVAAASAATKEEMAARIETLEATTVALTEKMRELCARNDTLGSQREQLRARVGELESALAATQRAAEQERAAGVVAAEEVEARLVAEAGKMAAQRGQLQARVSELESALAAAESDKAASTEVGPIHAICTAAFC